MLRNLCRTTALLLALATSTRSALATPDSTSTPSGSGGTLGNCVVASVARSQNAAEAKRWLEAILAKLSVANERRARFFGTYIERGRHRAEFTDPLFLSILDALKGESAIDFEWFSGVDPVTRQSTTAFRYLSAQSVRVGDEFMVTVPIVLVGDLKFGQKQSEQGTQDTFFTQVIASILASVSEAAATDPTIHRVTVVADNVLNADVAAIATSLGFQQLKQGKKISYVIHFERPSGAHRAEEHPGP